MRFKQVLAAGLVQDIKFVCKASYDRYLFELSYKKVHYQILETVTCDDGSIIIRILKQYNNVELIQLFDE